MNIVIILFLYLVPSTLASFDPKKHPNWKLLDHENCGESVTTERIIGGKNASLGAYPWIVRLGYIGPTVTSPNFRCGAVILNKKTILTAGHCVYKLPNGLKVGIIRIGELYTETDPDCQKDVCAEPIQDFKPQEVIVHKDYASSSKPMFKDDIAIIRLNGEIKYSSYVRPICIISGPQLTKNYVGQVAEVAGWGVTDIENPKSSTTLQFVTLAVMDQKSCKDAFVDFAEIGDTQMCVGGVIGQDSCAGDSGGPLMIPESVDDEPAKYYLLGVVSFGAKKCGATTLPGVYTKLSEYLEWVLDNLAKSTSFSKVVS